VRGRTCASVSPSRTEEGTCVGEVTRMLAEQSSGMKYKRNARTVLFNARSRGSLRPTRPPPPPVTGEAAGGGGVIRRWDAWSDGERRPSAIAARWTMRRSAGGTTRDDDSATIYILRASRASPTRSAQLSGSPSAISRASPVRAATPVGLTGVRASLVVSARPAPLLDAEGGG